MPPMLTTPRDEAISFSDLCLFVGQSSPALMSSPSIGRGSFTETRFFHQWLYSLWIRPFSC